MLNYITYILYSTLTAVLGLGFLTAVWFLCIAQTWAARGIAFIAVLCLLLPLQVFLWWRTPSRRHVLQRSIPCSFLVITLLGAGILFITPNGQPLPQSPVRHAFTTAADFEPYRIANIVPEIDQVNLGFWLMTLLDPRLTWEQARRVSQFTLELYREMERDPNFHQLGSVMPWAYAELLGQPFDVGHYYLYTPQQAKEGPLPAVLFLHGSVGNFKTYLWLWSQLAEREGFMLIAPSFGFGNWSSYPQSAERVLQALEDARKMVRIDPDYIYLAGISNGGSGVCEVANAAPELFRGLIFLSPVINQQIAAQPAFQQRLEERSILMVTGAKDRRIPLASFQKSASLFRSSGIDVTEKIYPDEDHFLFFSQPSEVLDDIALWLQNDLQSETRD